MIEFTIKEVFLIGGACASVGGLGVWTLVNTNNISALWKQKQDTNVCITSHNHIESDISEIKKDLKWLVKVIKENGGM
jgi:hypothetical protein